MRVRQPGPVVQLLLPALLSARPGRATLSAGGSKPPGPWSLRADPLAATIVARQDLR